jgi:hypothetical protein
MDLLAGLPNAPFFIAAGVNGHKVKNPSLAIMKAFFEASKKGDDPDTKKFLELTADSLSKVESQSTIIAAGEKGVSIFGRYITSDAEGYKQKFRAAQELMAKTGNPFGGQKFEVRTSSESIKGVEVTTLEYDLKGMPEQARQMVEATYGGKLKMQFAKVDDKSIVFGMNVQPDIVTKLQGADGLSQEPRIKKTTAVLPEKATVLVLIDPFGVFPILKNLRDSIPGINVPDFQAPSPLPPPIGAAAGSANGVGMFQLYVPVETINELVKLSHRG